MVNEVFQLSYTPEQRTSLPFNRPATLNDPPFSAAVAVPRIMSPFPEITATGTVTAHPDKRNAAAKPNVDAFKFNPPKGD
jgi:hypothetical protein